MCLPGVLRAELTALHSTDEPSNYRKKGRKKSVFPAKSRSGASSPSPPVIWPAENRLPCSFLNPIQMRLIMLKSIFLFAALSLAFGFAGCKKDAEQTTLHVRLTDGPGDYQQVNLDIREIRVKTSDDQNNWLLVPTTAGIYNLLDLQNGIDTLIASGPVPAVTLKEVRFVLGPDNSIMVDSILYPLQTPSAEDSGLKVKIDKNLPLDPYTIVLDIDAALSIHQQGNGAYQLKPVIKLK